MEGILSLTNTLVAGNFGSAVPDVSGAVNPSSGYNLIGDGTGMTGLVAGVNGNLVGTAALPIDPMLGPLQINPNNNSYPLATFALLPGSPAVDAGTSGTGVPGSDERGFSRPISDAVDIGAYELQQPITLVASSGSGQIAAVGTAFTIPLQITLLDSANRPLSDVPVTFLSPTVGAGVALLGGITVVTDAQGHASLAVSANTVAGSYPVVARVASTGQSTSFTLTNTPGIPATVTAFTGTPQSATVGTIYANPLQTRVTDVYGNPVPGVPVIFNAPIIGATAMPFNSIVVTDASGIATSLPLIAGTVAGTFTVTATGIGVFSTASFSLTNLAGPATTITPTSGILQSTTVNTPFANPLVATITDAYGNPVSGVSVNFTVLGDGLIFPAGSSVMTDSNGRASVPVTAGTVAGTSFVSVSMAGGFLPSAFLLTQTPGSPASVTATLGDGQSAAVTASFGDPLVVTVTDAYGNVVSGAPVTFAVPSSGASAVFSDSPTVLTDAEGHATAPALTANTVAGAYTVTASVAGGAAATFHLMNTAGAPSHIDMVSGSGQSVRVNDTLAAPLVARVTDDFGNPVSGVSVTFAAPASGPGGSFTASATVTTDTNGQATAPAFQANTQAGAYTVTAAAFGVDPANFTLTNTAGAAVSIVTTVGSNQSATVNSLFTAPLIASVTDAFGNPVSGVTVFFTAPGSGASASFLGWSTMVTDDSGRAVAVLAANTVAGSYSITASAVGVSGNGAFNGLTNLAGPATSITVVQGAGQTTEVNTAFAAPLVAKVTDAYGNPVSGVTVAFAAPDSGASAAFPDGTTAVTDGTGRASVVAAANTVAGAYTVTATATGIDSPVNFALGNTAGAAANVDVTGGNQSAMVNTPFANPLVATVTDAYGNPVSGAIVTFTNPDGGVLFPAGSSAITDSDGRASVPVTAGLVAGSSTVNATVAGVATPAVLTLTETPGGAVSIVMESGDGQSTTVNTAFGNPLVATVTDAFGNPVSGVSVTFAVPSSGASAVFSDSPTVLTDAEGHATAPALTANTVAGAYTVTASVAGGAAATFHLMNTAGTPSHIDMVSGSGQTVQVHTALAAPFVARVTDDFGNPVPGVSVTFAAPVSGPGGSFTAGATVTTDADGRATAPHFDANTQAGAYTITATAPGVGSPVNFAVTNTAGAAVSIVTTSGGDQSATVNAAFTAPLVATVTDAYGNPVSGVIVLFAAPTSGASASFSGGALTVTDANGRVSRAATANTVAGHYAITASAVGVATPASFGNLTNSAGAAAHISATGGGQSATVGTAYAAPLVVTVTDAFGNPVPSATVMFTGAGVTFVGGNTATTDATGHASKSVTATTTAGSFTVTASTAGLSASPLGLTNQPGAPAAVSVVGGADQSATIKTGFAQPVRVRVTDAFGNPLAGVSVTFSTPTTGATASFQGNATVQTDATGLAASPNLVANDTAGAFPVVATASGVPAATAQLTNLLIVAPPSVVVGQDEGGTSQVTLFDPRTGAEQRSVSPFGSSFTGGSRVASADFNSDGVPDTVIGTGAGVGTLVRVLDGLDGHELFALNPFPDFTGGVFLAVGDITGDGKPDLVVTPDQGGGPVVAVYDGAKLTAGQSADDAQIVRFLGIDDPNFRGGARASVGDFNADGAGDLIVAAGIGGGPRVAGFDGRSIVAGAPTHLFGDFFVFEPTLRNGVYVAAGDLNGDGRADLVVGGGPGGGPRVLALSGADLLANTQMPLANFFAGDTENRGGIRVAIRDFDGDGRADLATGSGTGGGSRVTIYAGQSITAEDGPTELQSFDALPGFAGGVFVG
jgi:hypothetical protein